MGRIFLVARHPNLQDALTLAIETQSQHALCVVGAATWDAEALAALTPAQPDVVVLIAGIDAGSELRSLERIRALVPGCLLLIVDTLGDANDWLAGRWGQADALLRSDQLATELVPVLSRLVAQRPTAHSRQPREVPQ